MVRASSRPNARRCTGMMSSPSPGSMLPTTTMALTGARTSSWTTPTMFLAKYCWWCALFILHTLWRSADLFADLLEISSQGCIVGPPSDCYLQLDLIRLSFVESISLHLLDMLGNRILSQGQYSRYRVDEVYVALRRERATVSVHLSLSHHRRSAEKT